MGLLGPEYYNNLLKEGEKAPSIPVSNSPEQPVNTPVIPYHEVTPTVIPKKTVEEQTKKFGGEVGSPEYYKTKAEKSTLSRLPGEMASAVGIELPKDEEWDKMNTPEKIGVTTGASIQALLHAVFGLPKAIASIPVGIAKTIGEGWGKATGKEVVVNDNSFTRFFKDTPSYFGTWDDAKAKGLGNLGAAVMVLGRASGDFLIGKDVGIALSNSMAPRAIPLKPGEVISDTNPIKQILEIEQNKVNVKRGDLNNPSEYHPLTKTDAPKFAGSGAGPSNTFFKFTPAVADGSKVELSIVRVNSGIKNFTNKIFGDSKSSLGKFGPEKKVYSQIIDVSKSDIPKPPYATENLKPTIPSAPLKGFENKLIDESQLKNIDAISKVNNIDPGITEGVVKALTGKDVIGDLTQAEYVNVAKTISNLTKAGQYAPESIGFGSYLKSYMSPTRYWTRDVELKTGLPVHTAHMQMESGVRLAKVSEKTQLADLYSNPIIEKYSASRYAGERALVKEYAEGNTKAITDNPSLTPEVKAELIEAAGIFDSYLKRVAEDIGMEPKAFIENYAPHIQERGGVYQLYKEKTNIPSGSDAFFKEKRTGGLYTQIGDMWALADIYTRSAYKAKYMAPVLDSINEFKASLPSDIAERFGSYVQEKLGYGDKLSKIMDSAADSLNKKLGLNLPPDTARVFTKEALSTMYSSAMSQPATWLRNAFQYPTLGYAYWGSKFMGDALKKSYSKEGMAEFLRSGFATDMGVQFGEEINQSVSTAGKIRSGLDTINQTVLKPQAWIENKNRAPMYFQTKMIFEDTVAKVNSGKLTWTQAEKELGLDKMNKIDANLIRQDLVKGDLKAASDKLIQNAIDDTQFPYRRGESARFQYGMTGKLLTPFMQWPIEYTHTISRWVGTGQWDKLGRLYASTSLITRAFSQEYNTDFSKSFGVNPMLNINLETPPLAVVRNGIGMIYNKLGDNEQAYEKNADQLFKSAILAIPGGVEGNNLRKAYKAYKNGPVGPDGTYAMPDSSGRPNYYNFRDLFWNALGMPTLQKVENQNLQKEMSQDKFNYTLDKKKVLNLYQDGLSSIEAGHIRIGQSYLEKANNLIEEGANKGLDLSPTDDDFNKYYIPATEQTWNYLPASLKAKFAPRVFNSPGK